MEQANHADLHVATSKDSLVPAFHWPDPAPPLSSHHIETLDFLDVSGLQRLPVGTVENLIIRRSLVLFVCGHRVLSGHCPSIRLP
jgi:hypothetical protein